MSSVSIQPFHTNWLAPTGTLGLQCICRAQLIIHTTDLPWNWKHLPNGQVQRKKVFWALKLHSYLCNNFSSQSKAINVFPKDILKSKACDQSIQARKKLFCHMIVKNYLCSMKVFDQNRKYTEVQNQRQGTQLTLLYCGRTIKCSHQSCCIRELFLKILQYPQETPVLESIADLRTNKRDPSTGAYLWILQDF